MKILKILPILIVQSCFSDNVAIEWPRIVGAREYIVEYGSKDLETLRTISKNSIVLDLESNKKYFFRVKAQNSTNESNWSEVLYLGFTNQIKINKLSTPKPTIDKNELR